MKKISTLAKSGNEIFKEPKLTIGLDLGDRTSRYCILDELGNVILEHSLPTTPKGIYQVFNESRDRQGTEPGVAGCLGAAAGGNRIVERANRGIRPANRANRQGSVSRGCSAPTSEGSRNPDCADLRIDLGRSTPISPKPGCRMFSRVASRAQEFR